MLCNNNFNGKCGAIFGSKLSGPPGDPEYRRTAMFPSTAINCGNKQWRYTVGFDCIVLKLASKKQVMNMSCLCRQSTHDSSADKSPTQATYT